MGSWLSSREVAPRMKIARLRFFFLIFILSLFPATLEMECAHCKKPATLACAGCKYYPQLSGDAQTVRYCGSDCQKSDWKNHKPECRRLSSCTVQPQLLSDCGTFLRNSHGISLKLKRWITSLSRLNIFPCFLRVEPQKWG